MKTHTNDLPVTCGVELTPDDSVTADEGVFFGDEQMKMSIDNAIEWGANYMPIAEMLAHKPPIHTGTVRRDLFVDFKAMDIIIGRRP